MKQLRFTLLAFLMVMVGLTACKKDEPEVFNVEDLTLSFTGTNFLRDGQVVGTVKANSNKGTLIYSITSQGRQTGLIINSATGVINVVDVDSIYEIACTTANQGKYKAVVTITNGSTVKTVNITLTVDCFA